jgi:hypothetical protein
MQESYAHKISAIHANPKTQYDHCREPAVWETDYKFFGEHATTGSNPEQVGDTHARAFASGRELTRPSQAGHRGLHSCSQQILIEPSQRIILAGTGLCSHS